MAQNDYLFPMVDFGNTSNVSYGGIADILKRQTPSMSQFLPELEKILSQSSQFLQPQIQSLKGNISEGMAGLQGAFGKRGLTGSSIEAQGLATAQGRGNEAIAGLVGDFAKQGAMTFAQLLNAARSGDVNAARQIQQMLAQAMGEELTSQRDISMLDRMQSFQGGQAAKNREQSMINSLIGLGGDVGSAALMKFSDAKLKENIKEIGMVGPVRIVEFNWNKEAGKVGLPVGKKDYGVLADDVKKLFPDAVGEKKGYMTVDYAKLDRHLVKQGVK